MKVDLSKAQIEQVVSALITTKRKIQSRLIDVEFCKAAISMNEIYEHQLAETDDILNFFEDILERL